MLLLHLQATQRGVLCTRRTVLLFEACSCEESAQCLASAGSSGLKAAAVAEAGGCSTAQGAPQAGAPISCPDTAFALNTAETHSNRCVRR